MSITTDTIIYGLVIYYSALYGLPPLNLDNASAFAVFGLLLATFGYVGSLYSSVYDSN